MKHHVPNWRQRQKCRGIRLGSGTSIHEAEVDGDGYRRLLEPLLFGPEVIVGDLAHRSIEEQQVLGKVLPIHDEACNKKHGRISTRCVFKVLDELSRTRQGLVSSGQAHILSETIVLAWFSNPVFCKQSRLAFYAGGPSSSRSASCGLQCREGFLCVRASRCEGVLGLRAPRNSDVLFLGAARCEDRLCLEASRSEVLLCLKAWRSEDLLFLGGSRNE